MKRSILKLSTCIVVILAFVQVSMAQNWNQFRGANRNGAKDNVELKQFTKKAPKLLWKKKIGDGFSEITVEGNHLYTMISEAQDSTSGEEFIAAYDATNGNELWRTKVDSIFFDTFGDGPRSTPAIGKDKIFSLSSYGKLTASSKKDGKTLWQVDFMKEFGSAVPRWGFSSSPVIVGNSIIIEVGGTESRAFMGFNKENGDILWKQGEGKATYNSPAVGEINGEKCIVFANGRKIYALTPEGETLWTFDSKVSNPTSMPIIFDGNKIFISAVRSTAFCVVEVKDNKPVELTTGSSMKNDYSSSIHHNGYIYGFHVAALQCIDVKTGEKKWTKRGFGKGSLIRLGDHLLVLSDKGKLIQVKTNPEAYTEEGSIQAIVGKSWTAPSYTDGKIYLRNLDEMACYSLE